MIINGQQLAMRGVLSPFVNQKETLNGVSYGLSEAGYDIRIKQSVTFSPEHNRICLSWYEGKEKVGNIIENISNFTLASTVEHFTMPDSLVGIVHDKSSWARRGLSVFNTVIEPGWKGFLTLELVYHGKNDLIIPAGSGIAQVIFHELAESHSYDGKYQNQQDEPVQSRFVS